MIVYNDQNTVYRPKNKKSHGNNQKYWRCERRGEIWRRVINLKKSMKMKVNDDF